MKKEKAWDMSKRKIFEFIELR